MGDAWDALADPTRRAVVSRLLKYFAGEGLVRLYRGGVTVLDKERLKQIANGT